MRLLIFDIDGTLLLNGRVAGEGFLSCFREVVGADPHDHTIRFHGRTDRGIFRALLGDDGERADYEELFGSFARSFTRYLRENYATAEGPHTLPGVAELVADLHAREDVALALGTGNIRDTAYVKLSRFGLDRFFPVGGFGGDHEIRADLVRAALRDASTHYGVDFDAAESWVIGDTPADIEAARAAGCRVLAVRTGLHDTGDLSAADVVLETLEGGADAFLARLDDGERVEHRLG